MRVVSVRQIPDQFGHFPCSRQILGRKVILVMSRGAVWGSDLERFGSEGLKNEQKSDTFWETLGFVGQDSVRFGREEWKLMDPKLVPPALRV